MGDQLHLYIHSSLPSKMITTGFQKLVIFTIYEPDACIFIPVLFCLMQRRCLRSYMSLLAAFQEILLEDGGQIYQEF